MDSTRMTCAPADWGKDDLSAFLDLAHDNSLASFAKFKGAYEKLEDIDKTWLKLLDGLDYLPERRQIVALALAFRAHASFRASTRLSLAGEAYESYVVDRACLESALYGLYIAKTAGAAKIWLRRNNDAESLAEMKTTFRIRQLQEFLSTLADKLGTATNTIYKDFIESGGHPNPLGVLGSSEMLEVEGGGKLNAVYLHDESVQLLAGLKGTAQAGFGALAVTCLTFETRAELLDVTSRLPRLASGL